MRTPTFVRAASLMFVALFGCQSILEILQPRIVQVHLVNRGDFAVDILLYYHEEQLIPKELLTEIGTRLEFTIAAGQEARFSRNCEALQAVVVDNADLRIIGQIGPKTDTDILRDGNDFRCGDTVVITFDHSSVLVDFHATVDVR